VYGGVGHVVAVCAYGALELHDTKQGKKAVVEIPFSVKEMVSGKCKKCPNSGP